MKPSIARRLLAAIAAVAIIGAVVTPLAVDAEPAEAAAYSAPFTGTVSFGGPWFDLELGRMFVGVPYSDTLQAGSGLASAVVEGGALPTGLSLSVDGTIITIAGTPRSVQDSTFSIRAASPDNSFQSYVTFNVSVLPAPLSTTVSTDATRSGALSAGGTVTYTVTYGTGGSETALSPVVSLTVPAGLTISSFNLLEGNWGCSSTATTATCTSSVDRPRVSGPRTPVFSVVVAVAADAFGARSVWVAAWALNSGTSSVEIRSNVVIGTTVLVAPSDAAYSDVTLTAYAPGSGPTGTVQFSVNGSPLGLPVQVSSGTATYRGPVPVTALGDAVFGAVYTGATVSAAETTTSFIYRSLDLGGHFIVNGEVYTGEVKYYFYSYTSGGYFIQRYLTGGSYQQQTALPHNDYYMWAEITDAGSASTHYNAANEPNALSSQATVITPLDFTQDMNFYWEIAPTFTHSTMEVPRQNVPFSEFFVATSNVGIDYSIGEGALPTGLTLKPSSGQVYGTPTVLGEQYSFTITADNGYGTTTTGPITGTVIPEHIAPTWTDSALSVFRVGQSIADGVSAGGDPTISYRVTDGLLPTGVTINQATGALEGAASELGEDYGFELNAHSAWGDVYKWFEGSVLGTLAAPVWTDDELGELRVGETLTAGVHASGEPVPNYTVTGLPSWAALNLATGVVTASPTAEVDYDFTITAHNSQGDSTALRFVGTVLPPWVAPFWVDDSVAPLQGGVALDDQVVADGDGEIEYSVGIFGTMPSWLTLNAGNGLVSGTPPLSAVGDSYSFTVVATSEHGSVPLTIQGVVAAAPAVTINIDFEVGDLAALSTFDFSVAGADVGVPYSVTVNSTPVVLSSGVTGALGDASGSATVPALEAGAHSLVLVSYATDGTPRTYTVWFTVLANGRIGAISLDGPLAVTAAAALAVTGTDPWMPISLAVLLLLAGVVVVRRSNRARSVAGLCKPSLQG